MSRLVDTAGSSRFTGLETAVMAALVRDQRAALPDLAGQFARARPGRRRNTAFGAYTELLVDGPGPGASRGVSGRFGTVHAMITGLPESVAFQVELHQGVVIGLHADSYGQDTRGIDVTAAHASELFTVDATGRSIPVPSGNSPPDSPARGPQRPANPASAERTEPPQRLDADATRPRDAVARPLNPAPTPFAALAGALNRPTDVLAAEDRQSLLVGLWVAIGAIALLAVLLFRVPVVFAIVAAFFAGRYVRKPGVLDAVSAIVKKVQEYQALRASLKS